MNPNFNRKIKRQIYSVKNNNFELVLASSTRLIAKLLSQAIHDDDDK